MTEKEKQLYLEEYKELGLCWRHDDQMRSRLTSILLPLSIVALTLSGKYKLLYPIGGMVLMTFWYLSSHIYMQKLHIRFCRIRKLEEILQFDSHLKYYRERNNITWNSQALFTVMFVIYLVIAGIMMFCLLCVAIGVTSLPGIIGRM